MAAMIGPYDTSTAGPWPYYTTDTASATDSTYPLTALNTVYIVPAASPSIADELAAKKEEDEPRDPPVWTPLRTLSEPRPRQTPMVRVFDARGPP